MTMKVAVLGGAGYIGKYLVDYLQPRADVTAVTRAQVDLLDRNSLGQYLSKHEFDVVIGAAKHPSWELAARPDIASHNLTMFTNVVAARPYFGRYINLGSGAEFDRTLNMTDTDEDTILERRPEDGYGLSRNIISRLCRSFPSFYTVRLWGVFGGNETPNKLFKLVQHNQIQLTIKDCLFDYISIQDLARIVEQCALSTHHLEHKDINAVYTKKLKITEQLQMFCDLHGLRPNWTVADSAGLDYIGSRARLAKLNRYRQGLESGMKAFQ